MAGDRQEQVCSEIEGCGGLDKIEFLQTHTNDEIYKLTYEIIETYFGYISFDFLQFSSGISEATTRPPSHKKPKDSHSIRRAVLPPRTRDGTSTKSSSSSHPHSDVNSSHVRKISDSTTFFNKGGTFLFKNENSKSSKILYFSNLTLYP